MPTCTNQRSLSWSRDSSPPITAHRDRDQEQHQHGPPPAEPVADEAADEDPRHEAQEGHLLLQLPQRVPLQHRASHLELETKVRENKLCTCAGVLISLFSLGTCFAYKCESASRISRSFQL